MARNQMGAKAIQLFRGGYNKLPLFAQFLGQGCCGLDVKPVIDRLPCTQNWENANIHTSPLGGRDTWQFSLLNDTEKADVVAAINQGGVGTQLEILLIPTFAFLQNLRVAVLSAEPGLTFVVKTRNGTELPQGNRFEVTEAWDGECGCPVRAKTDTDWIAGEGQTIGDLGDGVVKKYSYAQDTAGGRFALEADVVILEVASMPAGGVAGLFDILADLSYTSNGRSESQIG